MASGVSDGKAKTTWIRGADWVVAWNDAHGRHEYLRSADVVFRGDRIIYVGPRYDGRHDTVIDGRRRCVMPGLINIHSHPTNQPITRGVREEFANPALYMTALYDRTGLWHADQDGLYHGAVVGYCELLASGVTTVVDYAARPPDGWIDLMAASGLRVYAGPAFRDADWRVENGSRLIYDWDDARGRRSFGQAMALVESAIGHACGRLGAIVAPAQVDTCRAETLQKSAAVARERGLMVQIHACQTVPEFQEMTRRTGKTPIQWLDELGFLGLHATIAHGIFIDEHPWTHWYTRKDLDLLAASGTTVAHCPVVFSRYGHRLESFGKYLRRGVNIGIGTDSAPHNMLEEMRQALTVSRLATVNAFDVAGADAFNAATIGGARALMRDDIGRLRPGAKADLVLLDLDLPLMRPGRDPLRNLIYTAADRAVRDVYVDGRQVVADRRVLTLDLETATARLEDSQRRAEENVPRQDVDGRTGIVLSPLTLPMANEIAKDGQSSGQGGMT
jgi:cytosine/adenosine deaminase-related metal-dependent hydrolase